MLTWKENIDASITGLRLEGEKDIYEIECEVKEVNNWNMAFLSDATAAAHPSILQKLITTQGYAFGYGEDNDTKQAALLLARELGLFDDDDDNNNDGDDSGDMIRAEGKSNSKRNSESNNNIMERIYFVASGTACNALALRALTFQYCAPVIYCSDTSHINVDECGAPEVCLGMKLHPLPTLNGKLLVDRNMKGRNQNGEKKEGEEKRWYDEEGMKREEYVLSSSLSEQIKQNKMTSRRAQPAVISISQPTEMGVVYSLQELQSTIEWAHDHQLLVHMDGARLFNAAIALGESSLAKIVKGVDVLSLGFSKVGGIDAEAIVFMNDSLLALPQFKVILKSHLNLVSKSRYRAVQVIGLLEEKLIYQNAKHANDMLKYLYSQLIINDIITANDVICANDCNTLILTLPLSFATLLRQIYPFITVNLSIPHADQQKLQFGDKTYYRLMTSWATRKVDVDFLIHKMISLLRPPPFPTLLPDV